MVSTRNTDPLDRYSDDFLFKATNRILAKAGEERLERVLLPGFNPPRHAYSIVDAKDGRVIEGNVDIRKLARELGGPYGDSGQDESPKAQA